MCSCLQKGQSDGQARNRVPLHSHLQKQSTEELLMQQLNVYGCRLYLESVVSNLSTQLLSNVITRVPFKSTNIKFRSRTRHIEIHMHYIRELVHDGTIHLLFCSSLEQVADIFTKAFCEKTFSNLKSLLGISYHAVQAWVKTRFYNFVYSPCLREDFPKLVLPLSLFKWTCSM